MDGKRIVVTAPRIHYDEATLRVRGRGARTAEGKRIARRSKTPFNRRQENTFFCISRKKGSTSQ